MKPPGRYFTTIWLLLCLLCPATALAGLSASIDRDRVTLGDSLRLTLTADDDEELSDADLRPLLQDFEILQRSTSSNISIINGRRSQTKQMLVDISPKRAGRLRIPALSAGAARSNPLEVLVGAPADTSAGGQPLVFEAEVDQSSVHVQGQVILTLRLLQAISLRSGNLSELALDNAFVKPLEQRTFNRQVDGRPMQVTEVRYAIFPQQSGELRIPAQVFTGRLRESRRSAFDFGGGGRLVRRSTQPLTIEVLPQPQQFPGSTWLPARQLSIEERWSTPPEQLRAGESATRSIRITGEGLLGAQLPPVLFKPVDGLKFYPDQPEISEQEVSSGLLGIRHESVAVVPTRAGNWSIPEIRIPWWDTQTGQVRYAVLPGRELQVAAADPATATATAPLVVTDPTVTDKQPVNPLPGGNPMTWQLLAALSTAGWLGTLLYLWRSRRRTPAERTESPAATGEKRAWKRLLAACNGNDPAVARNAALDWAAALTDGKAQRSLQDIAARLNNPDLARELAALDACLYRGGAAQWQGQGLAQALQAARAGYRAEMDRDPSLLQLYPGPS